jgi:maleylpyruvate isomerase
MYPSDQARDDDIAELATTPRAVVVRRFGTATGRLDEALAALAVAPGQLAERTIPRTPGSARVFVAAAAGEMRLHEVEIHHVDLDLGYSPAEWSESFVRDLLTRGLHRPLGIDALLEATDLDWSHQLGTGGPTVTGPAAGLAWWLTGRAPYPGLEPVADGGELPQIAEM